MTSDQTSLSHNFAIAVILYEPQKNQIDRIKQIQKLGYHIYVFDNSPFFLEQEIALSSLANITYIASGSNLGISVALITLSTTAYLAGFHHLLFLDQDTAVTSKTLEFIHQIIRNTPSNKLARYAAITFHGRRSEEVRITDTRFAIGSGSVFNLAAARKIGWHNRKYFVDGVDYEFCLRARYAGYSIGLVGNTPDFDHEIEQPDRAVRIFNKRILIRRYSKKRIADTLKAYTRLITAAINYKSLSDFLYMTKSLYIYILGQLIARVPRRTLMKFMNHDK